MFALLAAAAVVWFLDTAWFPTIRAAILQLPATGKISDGKLVWSGDNPVRLAESRFLALAVDLKHEGGARSPAHVQVEFGEGFKHASGGKTDAMGSSLNGSRRTTRVPWEW